MQNYLHIGRATDLSDKKDRRLYRTLEIMPGFLAWFTIFLVVALSFFTPVFMAIFIIAFDVYWLIKTVYLSLHLRISYNKLKQSLTVNWTDKLNKLEIANYKLQGLKSWQDVYHLK